MNTTHIIINLLGQIFLIGILLPLVIKFDDYLDRDYYHLKDGVYVKCTRFNRNAKKLPLYTKMLKNANKKKQEGVISKLFEK